MLQELVPFLRQSVSIALRTSVDGFGIPTYGAAVAYRARVVGRRKMVRNAAGEEVLSTHTVYLAVNPPVGPDDRVTLSTGDAQSTESGALNPEILSVGIFPDDRGVHSTMIYLA